MAGPVNIIRRSVGFGGANQLPDVQIVQKLINAVPVARGGPAPALVVDGLCGPLTCGALWTTAAGGAPVLPRSALRGRPRGH